MRKTTAGLFASVDGVVESPNLWQFDAFDDELGAGMTSFMDATTAAVMGRTAYEEWAGWFPNSDDPFAGFINPLEKWVASNTLTGELAWENSTLLQGELVDEVTRLKQTEGGNIAVFGISVIRQLFFAGLLDELQLMVHPVVAGTGRHMFEPTDPTTRLQLIAQSTTSKGNVLVTYGLRAEDPAEA